METTKHIYRPILTAWNLFYRMTTTVAAEAAAASEQDILPIFVPPDF